MKKSIFYFTVAIIFFSCSTINKWETAKELNTIESYSMYLKEYPAGEFADSAKMLITEISNMIKSDSLEWTALIKTKISEKDLDAFAENHPNTYFKDSALNRAQSMRERTKFLQEEWQIALKSNTVDVFKKKYGLSEETTNMVKKLSAEEIKKNYPGIYDFFKQLEGIKHIEDCELHVKKYWCSTTEMPFNAASEVVSISSEFLNDNYELSISDNTITLFLREDDFFEGNITFEKLNETICIKGYEYEYTGGC